MAQILIVEDEERIASFVAKGLRAEGHQPTVVGDGPAGLDEALSGRFDLMVLDIGLPGMDGFEVLDQLRSQGSQDAGDRADRPRLGHRHRRRRSTAAPTTTWPSRSGSPS